MSSRGIVKTGHRGAAGHEPENTLAAVERGIVLGCDFVEVDIQRTSDGCLVLMHDKFIDRTTNGEGRVIDMSFQDNLIPKPRRWL
jgi:glycerophosphoryl diester phosphodiesterase